MKNTEELKNDKQKIMEIVKKKYLILLIEKASKDNGRIVKIL